MADLDLHPERRDLLASRLCAALTAVIPASQAELRGSLAHGTADRYSDIDILWVVPDDRFAAAVESAAMAAGSVHPVSSVRIDPGLALSQRRRLIFVRWASLPLFWRVNLDIRASSVAADDNYDAANPTVFSDAGWSRPASALENAIAAIKAAVRHQAGATAGLLGRGYERISADPGPDVNLRGTITRLADACAALEPGLADTAHEVHEVVEGLTRAGLLPITPAR